jgi:hypothetical protein
MATTPNEEAKPSKPVQARVLVDGSYGKPNDVVALPAEAVAAGVAAGALDDTSAAVAYAKALAKQAASA